MHRCPAYSPCCWLFPVSCGRMFHPKSLLSLDSSLINLCIQENHRTLQLAFKSPLVCPSPIFKIECPLHQEKNLRLHLDPPGLLKGLHLPRGGPPSPIFAPSRLHALTFIRVGRNVQKSNVLAGRAWPVQSLLLSICTDFFLFLSRWFWPVLLQLSCAHTSHLQVLIHKVSGKAWDSAFLAVPR